MTQIILSNQDFKHFQALVYEKCGINLHEGKKELVRARLSKRLRQIGINSFSAYYRKLQDDDSGDELVQMLDAISTNLTSFFREAKHFKFLETTVLPQFADRLKNNPREKLNIWSAGCSSGEEPYSLAICLLEHFGAGIADRLYIRATDISTRVLSKAEAGVYDESSVAALPRPLLRKYFQKGQGNWEGRVRVKAAVRNLIDFKRFNLMAPFPGTPVFQIIFCRNVMIYFDKETQERLANKYYQSLEQDGYLFIGHSESLMRVEHPFKYIQPTIYKKT